MKKVLMATDFSPAAEQLMNCIGELKLMGLEEVVLVHVVDIRIGEGTTSNLQYAAIEKLEEIAKKLQEYGIKTKKYAPIGFAATEIVQIAKAEEASLILIGSKGKSVLKEVFLGSTTFDVIRLTDVPILVEKYTSEGEAISNCTNKFHKILVPIDFSECSSTIINNIKRMPSVAHEVLLLSVVEHGESIKEIEESKRHFRDVLNRLAVDLEDLGIKTKVLVREGVPSKAITALADEEGVTSIIMGTRGRGLIKSLLLGSTSDAVARTSKTTVILIPCK